MDGIVIINKPKEYTSHDVVNIARKALKTKRIGHIGTLDPNATGVLVLCVNRATKLVKYFENHSKTYIATIRLGVQTDTDDITGNIVSQKDVKNINIDKVREGLNKFLGEQKQIPPNYSAVKVDGKKLYELARRDLKIPDIEPRRVVIYDISELEELRNDDFYDFKVRIKVSKGTYIRSIARDLGLLLENYGTLLELERTEIDNFKIEDSLTIEELETGEFELKDPFEYLNLAKFIIQPKDEHYVRNGRFLDPEVINLKSEVIIYSQNNEPLAIYYYDPQKNQMRMSVKWC